MSKSDDEIILDGYMEVTPLSQFEPATGSAVAPNMIRSDVPVEQYPEIQEAGRKYIEQFGDPMLTNTYLRVAVLALGAANALLVGALCYQHNEYLHRKPWIVRIDDVGRADTVSLSSLQYKPQEKDNKYMLTQWVQYRFQRNRFTVQKDAENALYFESKAVADAALADEKKTRSISRYKSDTTLPYVEVQVTNIVLSNLSQAPYTAQVEFFKVFRDPTNNSERYKERWTASITYGFRDYVPNDMSAINPLGLSIISYHLDQAYVAQTNPVPTGKQ